MNCTEKRENVQESTSVASGHTGPPTAALRCATQCCWDPRGSAAWPRGRTGRHLPPAARQTGSAACAPPAPAGRRSIAPAWLAAGAAASPAQPRAAPGNSCARCAGAGGHEVGARAADQCRPALARRLSRPPSTTRATHLRLPRPVMMSRRDRWAWMRAPCWRCWRSRRPSVDSTASCAVHPEYPCRSSVSRPCGWCQNVCGDSGPAHAASQRAAAVASSACWPCRSVAQRCIIESMRMA